MSEDKIPYQHEGAEQSAPFAILTGDPAFDPNKLVTINGYTFVRLDERRETTFNPALVNIERTILDSTTGHIKISYDGVWINDLPHRVSLTNGKFDRDDARWITVAMKWFVEKHSHG